MKPTTQQARRVAKALQSNVNTLLLATAYAQLERERVDKIQRRVLADMGLNCTPDKVYQLADSSAKPYYDRLNEIHLAAGFERAAEGCCPALCAETLQLEAEWALIEAAQEFFPDVTNDKLLCGTKELHGLECRQKYIDLLIGLVVNAPGYRSPLKAGAA